MISWVEFLVEERSMETALRILVPRIRPDLAARFDVHPFNGKSDLITKLPARLRGFRNWLPGEGKIVVVVDRDHDDCRTLKTKIEDIGARAGLRPKARRARGEFDVLVRLAIEELEAWYLGDTDALLAAYPGLPATLAKKQKFRNPDAVPDTWRALERLLQRAGYFEAGLAKLELARTVAPLMTAANNRSGSFRAFRDGLLNL